MAESETAWVPLYMLSNFVTAVLIVWSNKYAYNAGFHWGATLTALHFLATFIGMEGCARMGMFERKRINIVSVLPISLAFCGFVVFNNLSLKYNEVGMYQLLKVMTTPVIVAIQFLIYGVRLPYSKLATLVVICVGVGFTVVNSLTINLLGAICGLLGIFSTSIYQIWVKTEQQRLQCSPQQLLYYQAPVSFVMLCLLVPFLEDMTGPAGLLRVGVSPVCAMWVLLSAALAFLVNLSIFLVIGKTSPVSYNVLGHAKLCVIIISGYALFGEQATWQNLVGVSLAVLGIIGYTHLQLKVDVPAKKTS